MRLTACRRQVMTLFSSNPRIGFSEHEIRCMLDNHFDRTTIFRTVKKLYQHGFIHDAFREGTTRKYALTEKSNKEGHGHFHCKECGRIFCMEGALTVTIPLANLQIDTVRVLLEGKCSLRNCNPNTRSSKRKTDLNDQAT